MKKMKKWLALVLCGMMALGLAACGTTKDATSGDAGNAETTEAAKTKDDGAPLKIGYTVQSMENAYFVSIVNGMKAAAKEKGIDLIVADAQADASKHISQIEDFISQGVDAIIISPVDQEAPADAVKKAQEEGISVISLDQQVAGSDAFFGTDNATYGQYAGEIAGKWLNDKEADGTIKDILDDNGEIEVVVVRYDQLPAVIDRAEGLKKGLEEAYSGDKKINYVYEQDAADADTGYTLAETALTSNPKVSIFLCINDSSALGVYEACLAHKDHTPENTCIVGEDALEESLKLISEDTMYKGTVDIQPSKIGEQVLDLTEDVIKNGSRSEDAFYEMKSVTKENIGDYDIK